MPVSACAGRNFRQCSGNLLLGGIRIDLTMLHLATCEGIDIFEFNDRGTIQMMWGYWDPADMMAQLQG